MIKKPTIKTFVNDRGWNPYIATVVTLGEDMEYILIESIHYEQGELHLFRSFTSEVSFQDNFIHNQINGSDDKPISMEDALLWAKRYFGHDDYIVISDYIIG